MCHISTHCHLISHEMTISRLLSNNALIHSFTHSTHSSSAATPTSRSPLHPPKNPPPLPPPSRKLLQHLSAAWASRHPSPHERVTRPPTASPHSASQSMLYRRRSRASRTPTSGIGVSEGPRRGAGIKGWRVLGGEGEGVKDRICAADGDGEGVGGEGGADGW